MNLPLAIAALVLAYLALAWIVCRAFGIVARAGTAHLDRPLPADWVGSHPFMPGGSPAGEDR